MTTVRTLAALCLTLLAACTTTTAPSDDKGDGKKPDKPRNEDKEPDGVGSNLAASTRPNLQWKRYGAFENDLAQALALPAEELCSEFGREPCIRGVHLASLGGNDPFKHGLLEPSAEPLAVTPAVVDRVLLSACAKRVALDAEAGKGDAKVFGALDLAGKAPAPTDPAVEKAVTTLYRRLHARDPEPSEVTAVAELTRDDDGKAVAASEFATLACFTVGTSAEFLFF